MFGFGRGRGRGGRGFGFRGTSPPWPYIGRGRGGLPRCWAYTNNSFKEQNYQSDFAQKIDYFEKELNEIKRKIDELKK